MVRYTLTNLGKQKPWKDAILKSPPLTVQLGTESVIRLAKHCILQDSRLSGRVEFGSLEQTVAELSEIILGKSARWMLWRMDIVEEALELCFIDRKDNAGGKRRKYDQRKFHTSICRIPWYDGMNLSISADASSGTWDDIASAYSIGFREGITEDTLCHERVLTIGYCVSEETRIDVYTAMKS